VASRRRRCRQAPARARPRSDGPRLCEGPWNTAKLVSGGGSGGRSCDPFLLCHAV
jgi:hypothetical protein